MFTATKDDTISTLKNSGQNFRDAADETVSETKDDLRVVAGKTGRKVRELVHNASDEITHAKETVTTQIRSNPVQSSMIALGVGIVLGSLLRR